MQAETLLSAMVPPPGYRGDFGYICGFTAHQNVLAEMALRFTAGVRPRRIALAVFLHPPETYFRVIPGLQVLYPSQRLDFSLLHAKVALLRFVNGDASIIRLVVSTGNWTHETLADSIDLYWRTEWHSAAPDAQVAADIVAAIAMFDWLSERFDTSVLEKSASHTGLRGDLRKMPPPRDLPLSRFVSSTERPLLDEVVQRVDSIGAGRRNRLIMGSGFFESGESGVLAKIAQRLREARHFTYSGATEVVLNPLACQGLVDQAAELQKSGEGTWTFYAPRCEPWQAKLHAKFLFSAGGRDNCSSAWCYLGSGNLTKQGMLSKAGPAGNLEAGIVFEPGHIAWADLKKWLPVCGSQVTSLENLVKGADFEHPGQGVPAPPISYLEWRDGSLYIPEAYAADCSDLKIIGLDGNPAPLPCVWDPAPANVTLAGSRCEVPVWAAQGFVLPPLGPMRVEDVLSALPAFPDDPPASPDSEGEGNDYWGADDKVRTAPVAGEYPARRMMRLVTALCDRQPTIAEADWQHWSNRCEELLVALIKPEAELFKSMKDFDIDPLDALVQPAFRPGWLGREALEDHSNMLDRVRRAWGTTELKRLFGSEA